MIVACVDELCADDELISTLYEASSDYPVDFQLVGGDLGINLMPLVVKNGRSGHHG